MLFTSESLMKKSFTSNIIKEAMRLHSPAWAIDRQALEDDSFKNYSWKKGTLIILYITGLHRNPKYWKDPDSFIPERSMMKMRKILLITLSERDQDFASVNILR